MVNKIRCVIVDDELLAREGLRSMAEKDTDLQVIAECANGKEAIECVKSKKPDLLFLDIQMPEVDGFGVLSRLPRESFPYVIFVTAFDKYAVQAFDVHALDYLLKPVDDERFQRALDHAKQTLYTTKQWLNGISGLLQEIEQKRTRYADRFVIKEDGRIFFINISEIDWIEAQGNYAMIHAGKKAHLIREAMSSLENQLDPEKFFRIHRSSIVNIERIRELKTLFHGDCRITLHDGTNLLMSRRFRDKLRSHLSL